nr:unnamed protein product [Brassica rapa]
MSTIIIAFNNTDKKDDIAFNISPEPSMEAVGSILSALLHNAFSPYTTTTTS